MDSTLKVRTIDALFKDILRNRVMLVHKLQRKEGQWSGKQKSDLIDSIFRNIPLNPTYMIEETTNVDYGDKLGKKRVMCNFAIDGVQRLSTIRDYIANRFKISKKYTNMLPNIVIDGEEIDITGKYFKDLEDWVKEYFMARELQIYVLTNFSDEEVREMFRRQNAGSPLTNAQKNVVLLSDGLRDEIDTVVVHPFWKKCKLSSNDFKKDAIRNVVLQCMWAISDLDECPITDFLAKENGGVYRDFVPWVEDGEMYVGICEELKEVLDRLDNCIDKKYDALTKATISAVIHGMWCAMKDGRIMDKFENMLMGFLRRYSEDDWDWYRDRLTDGTYQHKKVVERLEVFESMSDNAASVDYIGEKKKEWEERMRGVSEVSGDNGVVMYRVDESDEDREIRERVNVADVEVSDEEMDRAALEVLEKM